MKKILFVCHGNICRSPMAEMVFKHIINENEKKGGVKSSEFFVDSAATDFDEIGSGIHRGTRNVLTLNEIPFTDHRARIVTTEDYNDFDLIVCMDEENLRHLERRVGKDDEGKIHKLLEYCGEIRDVADPWYTGNFTQTFEDVMRGCQALYELLTK